MSDVNSQNKIEERVPPHNIDAEQSVIGASMCDKDAMLTALEKVNSSDFYNDAHKEIFATIADLQEHNKNVDVLTVTEELKKRKTLEVVGGRSYVASLSTMVPTVSNVGEYASIVSEKSMLRKLIKSADNISNKAYQAKEDVIDILDYSERNIFDVSRTMQKQESENLSTILATNMKLIQQRSEQKGEITGVPSGLHLLDKKLNGFQKSDMIVLAARPAMGKTALVLNIALNAARKADAKIMVFSLEMSKEQLGQRLLSMQSRVEAEKMNKGEFTTEDWASTSLAVAEMSGYTIKIDDTPGIKMMEINNKCRRMKAEEGLDLVIIDYLQLMTGNGKIENRQQEISMLSRSIKLLARELDCPVIVLSQLSRAVEQRENKRPLLADLRESGAIEQDADIVLFLYRDEVYNEETEKPGVAEIIVAKHRNGPIGTVEVAWQGKYTRFADLQR